MFQLLDWGCFSPPPTYYIIKEQNDNKRKLPFCESPTEMLLPGWTIYLIHQLDALSPFFLNPQILCVTFVAFISVYLVFHTCFTASLDLSPWRDIVIAKKIGFQARRTGCWLLFWSPFAAWQISPHLVAENTSHFFLSHEFLVRNLNRAGLGDSSVPWGIELGHLVEFSWGLSWTGGSKKTSLIGLMHGRAAERPGSA